MILEDKYVLGFLPTPLHSLKQLSIKYKDYNLFIKRDDNTGLASGGNKTRKLEYLIFNVLNNKSDTVITGGAQQSNHCRQTAAACAIVGVECHLLLRGHEPKVFNGNLLLCKLLGANIHFGGDDDKKSRDLSSLKLKLESTGRNCTSIPYGGSNFIGSLGYVNAVQELKMQLIEQNLTIDYIFFASSSGGTQAGLILGKELFDLKVELMPISIDKLQLNDYSFEQYILNIVIEGKKYLNIKKEFSLKDINLIRDYNDAGYGVVTKNEVFAINELAKTEGIILDPVYTGRAFYGMLDFLKNNKIKKGANVLFWHTGGLPANFEYAEELM